MFPNDAYAENGLEILLLGPPSAVVRRPLSARCPEDEREKRGEESGRGEHEPGQLHLLAVVVEVFTGGEDGYEQGWMPERAPGSWLSELLAESAALGERPPPVQGEPTEECQERAQHRQQSQTNGVGEIGLYRRRVSRQHQKHCRHEHDHKPDRGYLQQSLAQGVGRPTVQPEHGLVLPQVAAGSGVLRGVPGAERPQRREECDDATEPDELDWGECSLAFEERPSRGVRVYVGGRGRAAVVLVDHSDRVTADKVRRTGLSRKHTSARVLRSLVLVGVRDTDPVVDSAAGRLADRRFDDGGVDCDGVVDRLGLLNVVIGAVASDCDAEKKRDYQQWSQREFRSTDGDLHFVGGIAN